MSEQITYLLANYNNSQYIRTCVNSLHAQTDPRWRCLIADDGSTDDSLAIIRTLLCDKIGLLTNEQNIGYIRTLMRLIEYAQTDIVGILDPDDALYPTATAAVLAAYQAQPAAGLVYTNYDFYDETLKLKTGTGFSAAIPHGSTSLLDGFVSALRTFRRSAYTKTAGLDPSILYAEDRDLVYKMEEVTMFVFVDQPLYQYRYVTHSQNRDQQKYKVGEHNHRRAYRHALVRRQITGRAKLGHLFWLYCRQLAHRLMLYSRRLESSSLSWHAAQSARRGVLALGRRFGRHFALTAVQDRPFQRNSQP